MNPNLEKYAWQKLVAMETQATLAATNYTNLLSDC